MQSSPSALPFKQTLAGASPATDAKWPNASCPRSSVRSERHRAKVEAAGATPAVDAISPLCLSSHRSGFVNRHTSVRVRPEAPAFACRLRPGGPFPVGHDVTAASRPVKAAVPVQIRLANPISIQGRQQRRTRTGRWLSTRPCRQFPSRWPSSAGGGLQSRRGWCNSSTGFHFHP